MWEGIDCHQGKSFITSDNDNKCLLPHSALHYSIDPPTSLLKSITAAPLMKAPNIAVNRAADPRPCHVLHNEANELTETFSDRGIRLYLRWKRTEVRLSREGRGCSVHTIRGTGLFLCASWLANRRTCRQNRCCVWYGLYVWWTAVCRSLCWVRWEVAVAFSDLTTGRSIWRRQAHTEGSCKVPFKGPTANCTHPHRGHQLHNHISHS